MLQISLTSAVHMAQKRLALCISAPTGKRKPNDQVIVIDTSGSTSSDATPGLPDSERDGISILKLVVHGIKVLVECTNPDDRVGVVCFDERAKLFFPMTHMTDENKRKLLRNLDQIQSGGGTQIWSGIKMGLETLRTAEKIAGRRNQSVMVFTDGLDVTKPHRGNMYALNALIGDNPDCSNSNRCFIWRIN